MLDHQAIQALARQYSLVLPDQMTRQQSGDLMGRGTGNSVEYQDHRQYFLGDDVRHIDWRAYARTDRLTLKMYRQEISPRVDIIVDGSRSCGVDGPKRSLLMNLAATIYWMASRGHAHASLWISGGMLRPLDRPESLEQAVFSEESSLIDVLRGTPPLRRRSLKVVVSDFLFEHDPRDFVTLLGASSDRLVLLQVLSDFEGHPSVAGGLKLVDADTGYELDLVLDDLTVDRYRARLRNLQNELARQVKRMGGAFAAMLAGPGLRRALGLMTREGVVATG